MENAKYVRIYKSSDFYNIQHLLNQDEKTLFVQLYISCISLVAVLQELTHLQEIAGHFRNIICSVSLYCGAGQSSRYSDWLRAGRSGDRIPVGARFSVPVQTGPGAHPSSCTMGTGSFLGVKISRGMTLTLYPLLVPWSWRSRAIPLLPLWVVWSVQSLSACTRVTFAFLFLFYPSKPSISGKQLLRMWSCNYRITTFRRMINQEKIRI